MWKAGDGVGGGGNRATHTPLNHNSHQNKMPLGRLLGIMCLVGVVPRGHYRLAGPPRKSLSSGIKTFRRLGGEVASPPPPPSRTPLPPPAYVLLPSSYFLLLLLPTSLILLLLPSSLLLLLMLLVIAALFLDLATSLLLLLFVLFCF